MNQRNLDPNDSGVAEDVLAGVSFADPYRWLEASTDEVDGWQREQHELTDEYLRALHDLDALESSVSKFLSPPSVEIPDWANGAWFRKVEHSNSSAVQVVVSDQPLGPGRVLFDAAAVAGTPPVHVSWLAPSPDGSTIALGLCTDGSEQNGIHLIDVATGTSLVGAPPQMLMDSWTCGVTWLPDSSGFYFSGLEGDPAAFDQRIYFHRRGQSPRTTEVDAPRGRDDYRVVTVSDDSKYAVLLEGISHPRPIAVAELVRPEKLEWRPFVRECPGSVFGYIVGDEYLAVVTGPSSPRGEIVAIPLGDEGESDPANWRVVVPGSEAVIQMALPARDRLFVVEMLDTYARIRVVQRDGEVVGEVPLPGRGAIGVLPFAMPNAVRRAHPEDLLFSFSSLDKSWARFRYNAAQATLEALDAPDAVLDNVIVEDHWVVAADGAKVPYHVLRRADVPSTGPLPTLLSGYGGFNIPWVPHFPGSIAAFVEAGGVFVHTHLRGGSDLGFDWWQQGRMGSKQTTFDDLYAIADHLIARGMTVPEKLALTGGSNGGLLCGAAITQRPELWRAVVPTVPILDLIGACRDAYGRVGVSMDYADIDDPDEVRRLAAFSPYHLIQEGTAYPSVFVVAGETDPRCPSWHARKFVARLQDSGTPRPALVRVWTDSGHGAATAAEVAVQMDTEWLGFVMNELGMKINQDASGHRAAQSNPHGLTSPVSTSNRTEFQ